MPRSTYPPLNMHFAVEFMNGTFHENDGFQSVQGLQARICENEDKRGIHTKFENIILKRAYQPDSELVMWCMDAINNHKRQPVDIVIKLLNAESEILSSWSIEKAVPVAWGVEELHAQETKILIETIELSYQRFQVLNSKRRIVAPVPIIRSNKT